MAAAHRAAWEPFVQAATPVVVIRDTPEPLGVQISECASPTSTV